MHCEINAALQYMVRVLGGILKGTKAVTARFRPIHCGFDTLRRAILPARATSGHRSVGIAANEQMTARGTGISARVARPTAIFADFRQC